MRCEALQIGRSEADILIDIRGLVTSFPTDSGNILAVDGVSFHINKGEIFGIVGESGCGKTMTALSIMKLVPPPGMVAEGQIVFEGTDLAQLPNKEMVGVRGDKIGMIFQEPMTSLNPVLRVGEQIAETLRVHKGLSVKGAREQSIDLLKQVGFDEPEKKYIQYPHQLSGGQRQRVLIAIAISCGPSLVIADEPTTALDVATESQIVSLLRELVTSHHMSMLFITHNLRIVKSLVTRVGIMYAGRMLEQAPVSDFFQEPLHPYSRALLESVVWPRGDEKRLKAIPGYVPRITELPNGCKFHPRCSFVMDICKEKEPPIYYIIDTEVENNPPNPLFGKTGLGGFHGKGGLVGERWVRCYLFQG